ncbi:hypothetical protein [Segatella bryantii]|uniref:hypothetical protein n=1 Tax=Segatella bryantii TaxID=77095 RepID=UPI00242E139A|nr:hypothetical protein [Segatella bryantii]
MEKEGIFIVIITCVDKKDAKNVCSSAILFKSFDEALTYARDDARYYKHLASIYTERIGENKHHAEVKLYGKCINKTYRISNMAKGGPAGQKTLENRMNTYNTCDYYDEGILF